MHCRHIIFNFARPIDEFIRGGQVILLSLVSLIVRLTHAFQDRRLKLGRRFRFTTGVYHCDPVPVSSATVPLPCPISCRLGVSEATRLFYSSCNTLNTVQIFQSIHPIHPIFSIPFMLKEASSNFDHWQLSRCSVLLLLLRVELIEI